MVTSKRYKGYKADLAVGARENERVERVTIVYYDPTSALATVTPDEGPGDALTVHAARLHNIRKAD